MRAPLARLATRIARAAALAVSFTPWFLGSLATSVPLHAQDWGGTATISSSMGVTDGRICTGEASRGDIGCAANAPYVSLTTGRLGIRTDQPSTSLHILHSGVPSGQTFANNQGLIVETAGNSDAWYVIQVATGAGKTFNLTTSGKLGLGMTTPSTSLHISGTLRLSAGTENCDANRTGAIKFQSGEFYVCRNGTSWETLSPSGGGASGDRIISGTTQAIAYTDASLSLVTAGTERMVIGTAGGIGIAQQPETGLALSVSGTTKTKALRLSEISGSQPAGYQGGVWMTSGTNAYYNSGNVGIGTNNPLAPLDLLSSAVTKLRLMDATGPAITMATYDGAGAGINPVVDINLEGGDSDKQHLLRVFRRTNTSGAVGMSFMRGNNTSNVGAHINANGTGPTYFSVYGGNFGIGTSTPHTALTVQNNNWPAISINTTAANDSVLQLSKNASGQDDDWTMRRDDDKSDLLEWRYDNASRMRLTTAGVLTIAGTSTCTIGSGTGATSCTSDKRLKTDIHPLQNSLEKIIAMQGVHFKWKTDTSTTRIGLIAQDVEKLFPEIVTTDASTGMKMVDYAAIVAPLIESVKTLDAKNKELETRLKHIENLLEKQASGK